MKYLRYSLFNSAGKLIRFALVGLLVMGVFMALNWALGCFINEQAAFLSAYPAALILHFYLNKIWTFENHEKVNSKQLVTYALTVLITFIIQWSVFTFCRIWTSWPAWIIAGFANISQMAISYLMMKLKVFVHHDSLNRN